MCGTTAGWLVQTCLQATEAGKLSTPHLRRPARAPSAVAPLRSLPSAMVRSSSSTTLRLCSPRFVERDTKLLQRNSVLTSRSERLILWLLFCVGSLCVCSVLTSSHMACIKGCVTFPICSGVYSLSFMLPLPQVNSDKIYWQKNIDGTFSKIYSEKKTMGHFISTKAVGSDERNDITHLYKHPEGIIKPNSHTEMVISQ